MEQSYLHVLNSVPGGIALYQIGKTLKTLMYTDGIPKMQGFTREEYDKEIAENALDIVYEADRPILTEMLKQAVGNRDELHISYRVYCKNREVIWVNLSAYPAEYKDDEEPIYQAIFSNTTAQFNFYQDICDNSTTAILSFDKETSEIYYANKNLFTTFSLEAKSYAGKTVSELFDEFPNSLFDVINGETGSNNVILLNQKYLMVHTREILWLHKTAILLYASDITNEYLQQEQLQRSYDDQVNYSRMLSSASIASSMVNLTKNCITLQDSENGDIMTVITQQTPQQGFEAMYPHIPDAQIREEYAAIFNTTAIINDFEKGITHKSIRHPYDRFDYWMEASYDAVLNPKTGDLEVYCFAKDVTEEELQKNVSNALISREFEDVILIDAITGKPNVLVNGSKSRVYSEQELAHDYRKGLENYFIKYSADDNSEKTAYSSSIEAVRNALETQSVYSISYSMYDSDNKIARKRASFSYLSRFKTVFLCTVQDITQDFENELLQRKKLENALEKAQIAMAAKTNFMANMSHDIRTPLNVIIGMSHIAQENDNPDDTADCLRKINTSSEFLLGLINDILDMERIESGKIELHYSPYSGDEFKRYISSVIQPLCEKRKINFEYNITGIQNFTIMQDKLRINQIFFNLLSNAAKFTPEGGKVSFKTIAKKSNGKIILDSEISDNGIGMSKEFQEHMFEPFKQENQSFTPNETGTGLGLSIVKQMCELMGLKISVNSELHNGTTFYIHGEYDVADNQLTVNQCETSSKSVEISLENKTILVCEDHKLNQEIICRILKKKGATVILADNGKAGLDAFSASKEGSISAILMDIRMPIMDGFESAQAIRKLSRSDALNVPIIALSANAYEDDVENCLNSGMNLHLSKPVKPEKLYETLGKIIRND